MPALSQWLRLMLAEIASKREDAQRGQEEEARRAAESRARTEHAAPPPDAVQRPVDS